MWRTDGPLFRDDGFPFDNFVTTRALGNMRDPAVRENFLRSKDIDPSTLVTAEQVHGKEIAVVTAGGKQIAGVDGLITGTKGLSLAIFTADCIPVFLGSAKRGAVGLVHAGWRGLAAGIIPRAVRLFRTEFGAAPADLAVILGPHIRACCYEVGKDLAGVFELGEGETHLDLAAAAARQLREAGVVRVANDPRCTAHEREIFFSYRRDRTADRIMSLVRLT